MTSAGSWVLAPTYGGAPQRRIGCNQGNQIPINEAIVIPEGATGGYRWSWTPTRPRRLGDPRRAPQRSYHPP